MLKTARGSIIVISSVAAFHSTIGTPTYSRGWWQEPLRSRVSRIESYLARQGIGGGTLLSDQLSRLTRGRNPQIGNRILCSRIVKSVGLTVISGGIRYLRLVVSFRGRLRSKTVGCFRFKESN